MKRKKKKSRQSPRKVSTGQTKTPKGQSHLKGSEKKEIVKLKKELNILLKKWQGGCQCQDCKNFRKTMKKMILEHLNINALKEFKKNLK